MTIYEKNIHTLAKYYPGMDHNIEKARKELKEELDLIEELSADGEPILKIKKMDILCIWQVRGVRENHLKNGCKNRESYAKTTPL